MKIKMKKAPHLLVGILALLCPLSAFAYFNNNTGIVITGWIISTLLLLSIFLVSFLVNTKYFKIVIKNRKLFLITIAPLILVHLIFLIPYISRVTEEMRVVEEYQILHPNCGDSIPGAWGSVSPCQVFELREIILSSQNLAFSFLFLYYLLIMAYGVYYLKKIDRSIGFRILKLSITVVVMTVVAYITVIIISMPTHGI